VSKKSRCTFNSPQTVEQRRKTVAGHGFFFKPGCRAVGVGSGLFLESFVNRHLARGQRLKIYVVTRCVRLVCPPA